jgi:hypothetical protein
VPRNSWTTAAQNPMKDDRSYIFSTDMCRFRNSRRPPIMLGWFTGDGNPTGHKITDKVFAT